MGFQSKKFLPCENECNDLIIGFYDLQKDPDQQQPLENQTLLFLKTDSDESEMQATDASLETYQQVEIWYHA